MYTSKQVQSQVKPVQEFRFILTSQTPQRGTIHCPPQLDLASQPICKSNSWFCQVFLSHCSFYFLLCCQLFCQHFGCCCKKSATPVCANPPGWVWLIFKQAPINVVFDIKTFKNSTPNIDSCGVRKHHDRPFFWNLPFKTICLKRHIFIFVNYSTLSSIRGEANIAFVAIRFCFKLISIGVAIINSCNSCNSCNPIL